MPNLLFLPIYRSALRCHGNTFENKIGLMIFDSGQNHIFLNFLAVIWKRVRKLGMLNFTLPSNALLPKSPSVFRNFTAPHVGLESGLLEFMLSTDRLARAAGVCRTSWKHSFCGSWDHLLPAPEPCCRLMDKLSSWCANALSI